MQRVLFVICCFVGLSSAFRNESESLRCGQNQVPACVPKCPPERTCRNRNIAFRCAEDPDPCTKKCVCADGYYKNAIGECITLAQCEQCDAPHTFYSCNSACDNECDKIQTQNRTNCPIRNIMCNKWCYCDDGYARDAIGNCVPVEECPKTSSESSRKRRSADSEVLNSDNGGLECGENEVPGRVCNCPPEKSCKNRGRRYRCNMDNNHCTDKCVCAKGYYRNSIGECITEKQCEQCDVHSNQFYSCNSACDNVCWNINTQNRTNCPTVNKKCNEQCYCDDGYARDAENNCIPISECESCGQNEVYKCAKSCPPELCRTADALFKCDSTEQCKYRCACKPGFYRPEAGKPCVPKCECPQKANFEECQKK